MTLILDTFLINESLNINIRLYPNILDFFFPDSQTKRFCISYALKRAPDILNVSLDILELWSGCNTEEWLFSFSCPSFQQ